MTCIILLRSTPKPECRVLQLPVILKTASLTIISPPPISMTLWETRDAANEETEYTYDVRSQTK